MRRLEQKGIWGDYLKFLFAIRSGSRKKNKTEQKKL